MTGLYKNAVLFTLEEMGASGILTNKRVLFFDNPKQTLREVWDSAVENEHQNSVVLDESDYDEEAGKLVLCYEDNDTKSLHTYEIIPMFYMGIEVEVGLTTKKGN